MRFIPLYELVGGEILAVNIVNANKNILMNRGALLTEKAIGRLKKLKIKSIYIKDTLIEVTDDDISTQVISDELKYDSIYKIRDSFTVFNKRIEKEKKKLKYGDSGDEFLKSIKNISKDLIDELLTKKYSNIAMTDIKNLGDYHYTHSINVAVLSLMIGIELKLTIKELENLVYSALLIDVGCQKIKNEIFLFEKIYSEKEKKEVEEHVYMGYSMLNESTSINATIKNIVLQHHERIDGSGYPNGLKGDEINKLAKIVMLADIYDAMISDRPHRIAHTTNEVFEHIMAGAGRLYDFEIANVFARRIVPYPVGTYVKLSNNQKAIVLENNENYPLRPILRLVGKASKEFELTYSFDLMSVNNLTIEKVIYSLK